MAVCSLALGFFTNFPINSPTFSGLSLREIQLKSTSVYSVIDEVQ